jgi:hypothetical protein
MEFTMFPAGLLTVEVGETLFPALQP